MTFIAKKMGIIMAQENVVFPLSYYPDFSKGSPIFSGEIYVGEADTDPQIPANQKQLTVRKEDGTELDVSQPILTGAGGVPSYDGSPVELLVDGEYSIKILNRFGDQEYYVPSVSSDQQFLPIDDIPDYTDLVYDSVSDAIDAVEDGSAPLGSKIRVEDYFGGSTPSGSGVLFFEVVNPGTGVSDGGKYIDAGSLQLQQNLKTPYNVKCWGARGNGSDEDQLALRSCYIYVGSVGGGTVYHPAGEYLVTAPFDTQVSEDEGAVFQFESNYSNLRIIGDGVEQTKFIPKSNELEIFAINGANNTEFDQIEFNNISNGILQNQPKSNDITVNGGVAQNGNAANAAIQQYEGSNLKLGRVSFKSFNTCCRYFGSKSDESIVIGTLFAEDVMFDDYCFGIIPRQPDKLIIDNLNSKNSQNSVNSDSSVDPGHPLYVTNRNGGNPNQIVVNNFLDRNGSSSAVKIRKGKQVIVGNVNVIDSVRGCEFFNIEKLVYTNINVKLKNDVTDTNQNGIEYSDMGIVEHGNSIVDVRGVDAWGVRVRSDLDSETFHNEYSKLENTTVVVDFLGGTTKAPVIVENQSYFKLRNILVIQTSDADPNRPYYDIRNCQFSKFYRPAVDRYTNSNWDRLIVIDEDCNGCDVSYSVQDFNFQLSENTVRDFGTNNRLIQEGPLIWERPAIEISSNSITVRTARIHVDTSGGADNLINIEGGYEGYELRISIQNSSNPVNVVHGTGNIRLENSSDLNMSNTGDILDLEYNGSFWIQTSSSLL